MYFTYKMACLYSILPMLSACIVATEPVTLKKHVIENWCCYFTFDISTSGWQKSPQKISVREVSLKALMNNRVGHVFCTGSLYKAVYRFTDDLLLASPTATWFQFNIKHHWARLGAELRETQGNPASTSSKTTLTLRKTRWSTPPPIPSKDSWLPFPPSVSGDWRIQRGGGLNGVRREWAVFISC